MTAQNQNVEMNEGESKKIVVDQTDDEDGGGDLNISGFNELAWVLQRYEGGPTIVEKTESGSSDVTVTDASIGAYEIVIQPSDTEGNVPAEGEQFYHAVRLKDSNGTPSDLLEGDVAVDPR